MRTPNSQANNRLEQLLLMGILLCAFWLRVYAIDASSLWSDEGNTWALLSRSFGQIAVDAAADIHPPGYYWLLKIWTTFSGDSAAAMRLFSAFSGTLLVLVVYCIGRRIDQTLVIDQKNPVPHLKKPRWDRIFLNKYNSSLSTYALLAALITAVNPLQIFYSQEARMYMPLALAGSFLVYGFMQILRVEQQRSSTRQRVAAYALYSVSGLCGLWIHYSFPICLAAVGLPFLAHILFDKAPTQRQKRAFFVRFLGANGVILFGYSPWLRIGIDRVLNWPKGGESVSAVAGAEMILQTFVVGPLRDRVGGPLEVHGAWLLCGGLLPILGLIILYRLERDRLERDRLERDRLERDRLERDRLEQNRQKQPIATLLLASWLFLPLLVMIAFGLFSEAFLKFILVAAPAWSLALAAFPLIGRMGPQWFGSWGTRIISVCMAVAALAFSWITLPSYYTNPLTRDNYAGIARYIDAGIDTAEESAAENLVVLNAPGQQEVWQYYSERVLSHTLPTLALPAERPIDEGKTIEALAQSVGNVQRIFALFWATDEADPNGVVEKWLDQHAFKGLDSWQGNVRFVRYDLANNLRCGAPNAEGGVQPALFGTEIELTQFCEQSSAADQMDPVRAGESVLIGLRWQTRSQLETRYKTTLQLLDARNQVIAQRDSEPGGGSMPTDSWQPNKQIIDNYGIVVPPGTPPGFYRLILALYDAANGQRLRIDATDHLSLSTVEVVRPDRAIPPEVVPMGHRTNRQVGPITLAGYDLYRKGYAHQPDTPVAVDDLVHVTLYWQAPTPLPIEWPADLQFTMTLGDQQLRSSLVSADYATELWENGEFVRGEFDILFNGSADQIVLEVGDDLVELRPVP